MKILLCHERFIFRFGVDRVLLTLGEKWKNSGHDVFLMGNHAEEDTINLCANRFIQIPEVSDYHTANKICADYVEKNWNSWFDYNNEPDVVLMAGWPFYACMPFFRKKGIATIAYDFGGVPYKEESNEDSIQKELRKLRKEFYKEADKVIAISSFLEETQSKIDAKDIETCFVHLGADHIDNNLWQKENDSKNINLLNDLNKLKEEGYKLIFQPGRWEQDNYKNSAESVNIIKGLKKEGFDRIKYLVLAGFENMNIPEEVKGDYYPLGFVDDATMKEVMNICDLGILPTLWEGFDLPLAEMQYIEKPMLVFNVGAHPEVVCHKYFLCEDVKEMITKAKEILENKKPINDEEYKESIQIFKEKFTWKNTADNMLREMNETLKKKPVLLMNVTNACVDLANAGISRTTRKISRYLQKKIKTVFVIWDDKENKFVFPNDKELSTLCKFNGPIEEEITYRSFSNNRKALDTYIDDFKDRKLCYLMVETGIKSRMQQFTSYLNNKNCITAAIFHDAIPVMRPDLTSKEISDNHKDYMKLLAAFDMVIPTANHNGEDLRKYWEDNNIESTDIKVADLGVEFDGVDRNVNKVKGYPEGKKKILFVSTLEPRKNHKRFIEALDKMITTHKGIENEIEVSFVGKAFEGDMSICDKVKEFCEKNNYAKYYGVVSDEELKELMTDCTFTVYPSEIEGFGMPIFESFWNGKPCLCNKEGSIGELAKGGGACLVDVLSIDDIASGLYKLITDESYYVKLQNETTERHITTWDEYSDAVINHFMNEEKHNYRASIVKLNEEDKKAILEYLDDTSLPKVILLSNFYPPNDLGGAEIIASKQAETLLKEGLCKPIVFTTNPYNQVSVNDTYIEWVNGVPAINLSVPISNYYLNNINFFNSKVNDLFRKLCEFIKPDIVHAHNINHGMSYGMFKIAKEYNAKVFATVHDVGYFCYKGSCLNNDGEYCDNHFNCEKCQEAFLYENNICIPIDMRTNYVRRMSENVDAFIFPSKFLKDKYVEMGFSNKKSYVMYNGIDVNNFINLEKNSSEKIRITYIGYFGKHKGVNTLINAVALLDNPNVELVLVGSGGEEENYLAEAKKLKIENQIKMLGRVNRNQIGDVYANTDIFCLPSIWPENSPVTLAEAMASAVPIVGTDFGGIPELIEDGVNGYLFELGNAESLADKLKKLVDDKELREEFGNNGRKKIKDLSFEVQMEKLSDMYLNITPLPTKVTKKIVLYVGKMVPIGINRVVRHNVFLYEWVDEKEIIDDTVAIIIQEGEMMPEEIFKYDIPIYIHESDSYKIQTLKDNIKIFKSIKEVVKELA